MHLIEEPNPKNCLHPFMRLILNQKSNSYCLHLHRLQVSKLAMYFPCFTTTVASNVLASELLILGLFLVLEFCFWEIFHRNTRAVCQTHQSIHCQTKRFKPFVSFRWFDIRHQLIVTIVANSLSHLHVLLLKYNAISRGNLTVTATAHKNTVNNIETELVAVSIPEHRRTQHSAVWGAMALGTSKV